MNTREALRALVDAEEFPEAALRWLLDNWDEARGPLLQTLARCASDLEGASDDDFVHCYFVFHLMAQKRETKAFPLLCAIARAPVDGVVPMFGFAIEASLSQLFASLFDGNVEALTGIAELDRLDPMMRTTAFDALAIIAILRPEFRGKIEDWLVDFSARGEEEVYWDGWALAAATLGMERLRPHIEAAIEDMRIDAAFVDMATLEPLFALARQDPTGRLTLEEEGVGYIDDAITHLRLLEEEEDALMAEADMDDDHGAQPAAPAENPFRDVGRNDPCPCGSGKKFKKCCLAA